MHLEASVRSHQTAQAAELCGEPRPHESMATEGPLTARLSMVRIVGVEIVLPPDSPDKTNCSAAMMMKLALNAFAIAAVF